MRVIELHTNEGVFLKRTEPSKEAMFKYIKLKRKEGYSLKEITYCWTWRIVHS